MLKLITNRFIEQPMPSHHRRGFTLVELLVVIVIIGILISMLLPAVQSARNSARSTVSKNNLRQIQLAMIQHEAQKGFLPPSGQFPDAAVAGTPSLASWSIQALILPYLEQSLITSQIDFKNNYSANPMVTLANGQSVKLSSIRVPTYVSPAEPRDEAKIESGVITHYPLNFAVNLGTWFVYDPATKKGGNGAAYQNSQLRSTDFTDGTTSTMGFAEVKAWQPGYSNKAATAATLTAFPTNGIPTVADVLALCSTPATFSMESGHTEWVEGRAKHCGFTSTFLPNQKVLATEAGVVYDIDWVNWSEGRNLNTATPDLTPTYAAVTARSHFPGGVNVSMMDGSVRNISDNIDLGVWRAISTRNGKEFLPDSFSKQ